MSRIALIGTGNLADSLVRGMLKHNYTAQDLSVFDIDEPRMREFGLRHTGIQLCSSIDAAVQDCAVVILCVKPNNMRAVCQALQAALPQQVVVISVAAGVVLEALTQWLGRPQLSILRCMPNLSVSVGLGMSVLCANSQTSKAQCALGEGIFKAVGEVCWIEDEKLMDAVTALSGSGPAYFFYIVQALEHAAIQQGLDEALAHKLALQTMLGAAVFAQQSDQSLEQLCKKVASKGGTTEAALAVFEQAGLGEILGQAFAAALHRCDEISKNTRG